jgi:hypothetical protein
MSGAEGSNCRGPGFPRRGVAWALARLGDADAPVRTGLGQPLVTASGIEYPIRGRRTHAVVGSLFNGFDVREPVVWVARGDSMRRASISILSGGRDGTGSYGQSGRHLWSGSRCAARTGWRAPTRSARAMELVARRAAAVRALLRLRQRARWRWRARLGFSAECGRHDGHRQPDEGAVQTPRAATPAQSDCGVLGGSAARRRGLSGDWSSRSPARPVLGVPHGRTSGMLARTHVPRSVTGRSGKPGFCGQRCGGSHRVDSRGMLPGAVRRVGGGVSVARLAVPVWSDLAQGQGAFLQDTCRRDRRRHRTRHARLPGPQLGRTTDRAVLFSCRSGNCGC